jgi:hypothetical protein
MIVLVLASRALAQEQGGRPEELKVYDRLKGVWEGKVTSLPAEWNRVETSGKATEEYQGALDESFVTGRTYGETRQTTGLTMWGYDGGRKLYRMWYFGAGGIAIMWEGAWNEQTQTLTLRTDITPEIVSTATLKFIDKDTREYTVEAKGSDGKVYQKVVAKFTRKK